MLRVRVVKTASGSSAVQIIYYQNRKRNIFKHIGSGSTDDEIYSLKLVAQDFINNYSPTLPLLEDSKSDNLLLLNKSEFLGLGCYDLDKDGKVDLVLYEGQKPAQPGPQYYTLKQLVLENGKLGGNIIANPGEQKVWNEDKDYLYPIPIQELLLNPDITQNPGWK